MRPDEKYIQRQEKRMAGRMRGIFTKQRDYVIEAARQLYPQNTALYSKNELTSIQSTIIAQIVFDMPLVPDTADEVVRFQQLVWARQAKRMIKQFEMTKFGVDFESVNPRSVKRLAGRHAFELSQRAGTITSTTNSRIKDILHEGIKNGTDYRTLSKQIQALSAEGVFSQARGELIATTEIGRAYGDGNHDVIDEFKKKNPDRQPVKKWVTVKDHAVRETHTQNERDGWIPDERQHSGTGEMYAPSTDYRCRCFERYSLDIALAED